jgi:hypothetical protein
MNYPSQPFCPVDALIEANISRTMDWRNPSRSRDVLSVRGAHGRTFKHGCEMADERFKVMSNREGISSPLNDDKVLLAINKAIKSLEATLKALNAAKAEVEASSQRDPHAGKRQARTARNLADAAEPIEGNKMTLDFDGHPKLFGLLQRALGQGAPQRSASATKGSATNPKKRGVRVQPKRHSSRAAANIKKR